MNEPMIYADNSQVMAPAWCFFIHISADSRTVVQHVPRETSIVTARGAEAVTHAPRTLSRTDALVTASEAAPARNLRPVKTGTDLGPLSTPEVTRYAELFRVPSTHRAKYQRSPMQGQTAWLKSGIWGVVIVSIPP